MWRRTARLSPLLSSSAGARFLRKGPQASYDLHFFEVMCTGFEEKAGINISSKVKRPLITFVLGGPGSGKGTQCAKIAETFGFTHLSAGDLLRKEMSSDSKYGLMISDIIKQGKIVPSEVTVKLLQETINSSQNYKFLIDGFPRSDENRIAFERIIGIEPCFVLYFDIPEDEMVKRVLGRNEGRIDDNIETVKKRLQVFAKLSLPVIDYYSRKGKFHKVLGVGTMEEVFEKVSPLFASCVCS